MAKKKKASRKKRYERSSSGFRSRFEERIYANALKDGIEVLYEPTKFTYMAPAGRGSLCGDCSSKNVSRKTTYTPDFLLRSGLFVEGKGRLSSANRTRLVAFKAAHPEVKVNLLFQVDNWMTKKKLKRYSDWATAEGFEWAVGERIPREWNANS